MRPLLRLVWSVSPPFFVGLLVLTLILGLVPLGMMLAYAALLNLLTGPLPSAGGVPTRLFVLLVLLGSLRLTGNLVQRVKASLQGLYQTRVASHIRYLIAEKMASLDLEYFENPAVHNSMTASVGEAAYRPVLIIEQSIQLAAMLVTLVSVTAVLFVWQTWVVPAIAVGALLAFWTESRLGSERYRRMMSRTDKERRMQYLWLLLTGDSAAKEVRLFGLRDYLLGAFRKLTDWLYDDDRRLVSRRLQLSGAVEAVLSVLQPALVGVAALQMAQGSITLGAFSLFTQSAQHFQETFTAFMVSLGQYREHSLFMSTLFRLLDAQPNVERTRTGSCGHRAAISPTPRITFHDVCFRYPGTDTPVLDKLSMEIETGETVALVGDNGAGKTTLVKLLAGLYQPDSGSIRFDGVDISTLDRGDLRSLLSVVFQDYTVYHLPAHENIGFGDVAHMANRERILDAARRSGFDTVARGLPYGYDTVLERFYERGHELSGGQRQLVALSRALLRDAPILVLDEPSAALDIHKEIHFFETLHGARPNRRQTVLFISHRLATVRRADRILLLEAGGLRESGTHSQLMARNGPYAELFRLQAERFVDMEGVQCS